MCQRCAQLGLPFGSLAKMDDAQIGEALDKVLGALGGTPAPAQDYVPGTLSVTYLDGTEESWTNVKDITWDGADAFPEMTVHVDDRTQVTIPLASIKKRTATLPVEDPNL